MRALEFETTLGQDSKLTVPDDVALEIPKAEAVRVIVLLPETDDAAEWRRLGTKQFLAGYAEGDSIYDAV